MVVELVEAERNQVHHVPNVQTEHPVVLTNDAQNVPHIDSQALSAFDPPNIFVLQSLSDQLAHSFGCFLRSELCHSLALFLLALVFISAFSIIIHGR